MQRGAPPARWRRSRALAGNTLSVCSHNGDNFKLQLLDLVGFPCDGLRSSPSLEEPGWQRRLQSGLCHCPAQSLAGINPWHWTLRGLRQSQASSSWEESGKAEKGAKQSGFATLTSKEQQGRV